MKAISEKQYLRVMAGLPDSPRGRRDRGLFDLMYYAGLRSAEAVAVMPEHYEARDGEPHILVLWGKGGRERYVPIGHALANSIEAWLASGERPDPEGPLYPVLRPRRSVGPDGAERVKAKPGLQVDTSQLRATLARLSRAAEVYVSATEPDPDRPKVNGRQALKTVRKPLQPHALRHSHAMDLLTEGNLSVRDIQEQLGHASLATTQRYLKFHDRQRAARIRMAVEGIPVDQRLAAELTRIRERRLSVGEPEGMDAAFQGSIELAVEMFGRPEVLRRIWAGEPGAAE